MAVRGCVESVESVAVMAKKSIEKQPWVMPTAAGVVGLGLGYWLGKKQTTAPGGRALPAGQPYVPVSITTSTGYSQPSYLFNVSGGQGSELLTQVGSVQWTVRTALDRVALSVVEAIYPRGTFTADPCRDWLTTSLDRQRSYVTSAAQRGVSLAGFTVDAVVGAISAQCSGRAIATPVAPTVYRFGPQRQYGMFGSAPDSAAALNNARSNAYNLLQSRGYTCQWWVRVQDVSRLAALNYVLRGNENKITGASVAQVRDALTAWCKSVVNASQNITV